MRELSNIGNIKNNIKYYSIASRGRNPDNPSDRRAGNGFKQRLEINSTGFANSITTVAKDSWILEVLSDL